jgi:hypothetical protein
LQAIAEYPDRRSAWNKLHTKYRRPPARKAELARTPLKSGALAQLRPVTLASVLGSIPNKIVFSRRSSGFFNPEIAQHRVAFPVSATARLERRLWGLVLGPHIGGWLQNFCTRGKIKLQAWINAA